MKTKNKILSLALLVASSMMVGCTDNFDEVNSDPAKVYDINLQSIFPGTVYRTMNVISELNYQRMLSYSRYVTILPFQKAWQGSEGVYRQFYIDILRDLNKLEQKYENNSDVNPNSYATILTWKALVYYQMISLYGPVGLSDTGLKDTAKRTYNYDSEEDAYLEILDYLDKAVDLYDPNNNDDVLLKDPVYDSDITKWRKLANTLRLEIAMNIQNISSDKAREYAAKSMQHEDWIFSSLDDQLAPQYGDIYGTDGSYYYTQFDYNQLQISKKWDMIPSMNEYLAVYLFSYNDPRMYSWFRPSNDTDPTSQPYRMRDVLTRTHDCDVYGCSPTQRVEHMQLLIEGKQLRDSLLVRYTIPYVPTPDGPGARRPFGWLLSPDPTDNTGASTVPDPLNLSVSNRCFVQPKFYAIDFKLPILRWTDACFLEAEAKVKFGLGAKSAETYYNQGISASFDEWGISSDSLATYMARDGVKWGTSHKGLYDTHKLMNADINGANGDEGHLEQIYKQRWLAGFYDGLGAWRLERRTRSLNFPPFFMNGEEAYEEGSDRYYAYPERLMFDINTESVNNRQGYLQAIDLLQKASPEPNSAREGNNVFTTLQFAKPVPNKEATVEHYRTMGYVDFNMDMRAKYWGKNYEEFVANARKTTGDYSTNAETLLENTYAFEILRKIGVYVVNDSDSNK